MKLLYGDTPITPLSLKDEPPQNLYDRLNQESQLIKQRKHELRQSYEQIQLQECSFKPRISQRSIEKQSDTQKPRYMSPRKVFKQECPKNEDKEIKLDEQQINQLVNRLYNAKRVENDDTLEQHTSTIKYNEKYVIHHFVREFYKALTYARCETLSDLKTNYTLSFQFYIDSDLCLITFREMCQILDTLGFVPLENRKLDLGIYERLQCPNEFELILSRNLLCFLLCVQGYNQEMEKIPNYENQYKINFPPQYNNGVTQFINGNLRVYNTELLQQNFQILRVNYLAFKKSSEVKEECNTTFKTSKQTQAMAQQYRKRVASEIQLSNVHLNDYDLIYQRKKEKLIHENDKIAQQRCTFNPKINETNTSSKYLKPKVNQPVNKSQENIHQFIPNIKKSSGKILEIIPQNTENAIERMIKGRVQRHLSQAIVGTCNLKKRQQLEEQIIRKQKNSPLMYIDIILDNEKKERITVKENDSAQKLAAKFISQNNIDKFQQDRLTKLLELQLQQI